MSFFQNIDLEINTKSSKNNKYCSVSIKAYMKSPKDIINLYKEVGVKVPDVISL